MTPEEIRDVIIGGSRLLPGLTLPDIVLQAVRAGMVAEREACARLAEGEQWERTATECSGECGGDVAAAIRNRST